MEKILSIIIPSYNMEKYLPKCLGSILQSLTHNPRLSTLLDIIVVNDGSKDRTSEIAHDFERRYPGVVRVIDKPNGNYGSCVNAALPVATGAYVKLLDADDTFEPEAFDKFVQALLELKTPLPELVVTDYDEVDENGLVTKDYRPAIAANGIVSAEAFLKACPDLQLHAPLAYRTEILRTLGYRQLEGVSYTDSEWALLPICAVRRVAKIPLVVYKYLIGRVGQTMDLSKRAKSWWMNGEVLLDMLTKLASMSAFATPQILAQLTERLRTMAENVYRCGMFGCGGLKANIDLRDFDGRLKAANRPFYDSTEDIVYSKRIPYRFVSGWRRRVWWHPLMKVVCQYYTSFAMFVYRLRQ